MLRLVAAVIGLTATVPAAHAVPCAALSEMNAEAGGVSLVVIKDGALACEDYPAPGAPDRAWELASGTKSFSGIMAAAAVQDGLLRLDEPVAATLEEFRGDPALEQITIRDVLSLTSGLSFGEHDRIGRPPAYDQAAGAARSVAARGATFVYGPGPFQLFGAVMQRKLDAAGLDADPAAYFQRRIFDPLGIVPARWRDRGGDPHLPSGVALTARDWAVFGVFVLEGGAWGGEHLVDARAFAEQFQGTAANPAYGLGWWLAEPVDPARSADIRQLRRATDITEAGAAWPDVYMAAGAGKQRLYVIPSEGVVAVRQTDRVMASLRGRGPDWSDVAFVELLLSD
ncbi:MAG: serine hydrolase [Oceanicaulis sp.]